MSDVVEAVGGVVDKLLGSPVEKSEERAEEAAEKARQEAQERKKERAAAEGVKASRILAVDEAQRERRRRSSTGSAGTILTGRKGPALPQ